MLLHTCAEPNCWIRYVRRAAFESVWYCSLRLGTANSARYGNICMNLETNLSFTLQWKDTELHIYGVFYFIYFFFFVITAQFVRFRKWYSIAHRVSILPENYFSGNSVLLFSLWKNNIKPTICETWCCKLIWQEKPIAFPKFAIVGYSLPIYSLDTVL